MVKIIPVGIYGPYPAASAATNCFLVSDGETEFILDMGCGALSVLKKYTDPGKLDAVILSHLHYDHCCDIFPFSYTGYRGEVYCPDKPDEMCSLLKHNTGLNVKTFDEKSVVKIGKFVLTFFPVIHPVKTFAVKVSHGEKSFVYTSDTKYYEPLAEFIKGTSFALADCTSAPGTPHMTPEEGMKLSVLSGVKFYGDHMNPNYDSADLCSKCGIEKIYEGKEIIL